MSDWDRLNIKVPIYFSAGMHLPIFIKFPKAVLFHILHGLTIQANMYYKMLISWTSQKIKQTYTTRNAFDFKNGTIGHKLRSGKPTKVAVDKDTQIDVRCQIHQLSFSPHTDAKGTMDLVRFLSPKHVILVHGEKPKMASLKERIQSELGIQTYFPANCETVCIPSTLSMKVHASDAFIQSCPTPNFKFLKESSVDKPDFVLENANAASTLKVSGVRVAEGILVMGRGEETRIIHQDELPLTLGQEKQEVQFAHCCPVHVSISDEPRNGVINFSKKCSLLQLLFEELSSYFPQEHITNLGEHLQVESFIVSLCLKDSCPYRMTDDTSKKSVAAFFCCTWSATDEKLTREIISTMEKICLTAS